MEGNDKRIWGCKTCLSPSKAEPWSLTHSESHWETLRPILGEVKYLACQCESRLNQYFLVRDMPEIVSEICDSMTGELCQNASLKPVDGWVLLERALRACHVALKHLRLMFWTTIFLLWFLHLVRAFRMPLTYVWTQRFQRDATRMVWKLSVNSSLGHSVLIRDEKDEAECLLSSAT